MDPRCALRSAFAGAVLAACAMSAHAQLAGGRQMTVIQTVTTSTYLNGGIGVDEQAAMHRVVNAFPLRMSFSEREDGEFLADIPMMISDSNGNSVFELRKAGPMLYVALPPGRYKVTARFGGVTQTQGVTLAGNDGKDLHFHWGGASPRRVLLVAKVP